MLLAQGDCPEEDPLNTAANWSGYLDQGEFTLTDVEDEEGVCGGAIRFSVSEARPNFFDGGFFYGQAENVRTQPGQPYRMSMRYRSTTDRTLEWRVIDRRVGTTGGPTEVSLVSTALSVTPEYQDYSVEFMAVDTSTVDRFLFFIGLAAESTAPIFIDDFLVEAVDAECEEGPFNDIARWSTYASSGVPQLLGEVQDEGAVCGNAIRAKLQQLENSPFSAGLQINQNESPRFNADASYRVTFRYRSDEARAIYYRMVPRSLDNSGAGRELVSVDLMATTEYQQFDTVVTANSGQDSMLYQLWMNGDDLSPIYIDDFDMVQVGGPCSQEDEFYNTLSNYTAYGPIDTSEVMDENAACGDAFAITLREVQDGPFNAGFEIQQSAALDDVSGQMYTISFDYRATEARTVPIFITSRERSSFGDNDGPQYGYAELNMTTEYQTYSTTFMSTIDPSATNRLIHVLLAVGSNTATVFLDNIRMERFTPPRTERTTFYVSPDGNDENDGTELSATGAFRTLRYALNQLIPGDSLLVADGVYQENNLRVLDVRGSEDAVTVVKSINPWGAKIEGDTRYNINLQVENSTHVVIEGFEIYSIGTEGLTNQATGLQIFGSDYVTLENNYVHDCGCGGISGRESDYMTIRRNVARDNARYSPFNCSGISIYQPRMLDEAEGVHILIQENVSFENEVRLAFSPLGFSVPTDGNGIILDDYENTQSFDEEENQVPPYTAQTLVENNLVFGNGGAGIKTFKVPNVTIRTTPLTTTTSCWRPSPRIPGRSFCRS